MKYAKWVSVSELIDLYLQEKNRPPVIDLSGGQPDLIPEWIPWTIKELINKGLENDVYLWSDDNLSNDYFWKYLSNDDIDLITSYKNYGKVCCFKGFDSDSFSFNTSADPRLFDQQFLLLKKFLKLKIDIYCYVTLTSISNISIPEKIAKFFDRLQDIDHNLPLRTIPLEIIPYSPVKSRLNEQNTQSMVNQQIAIKEWNKQIRDRFRSSQISKNITDIHLGDINHE